MKSIRRHLTWSLLLGLLALLVAGNLVLRGYVRSLSIAQFDAALESKARAFAGMMEQEPDEIELEFRGEFMPEFERDERAEYFQIWTESGDVVERSLSLRGKDLPRRAGPLSAPEYWDLALPDGRSGRAIGIRFVPEMEDGDAATEAVSVEVVLARDRAELDRMLSAVSVGSWLIAGLMLAGITLLVPRVVRRGLQPLDRLAERAAAIDSRTLDARFPSEGLPAELLPIADKLNGLLERLEKAFKREKRLTADIAHELKTPIAELRSLAEVFLKWPDDEKLLQQALTGAVEISETMDDMVSTLLSLARCESGRQSVAPEPLELGSALETLSKPHRERAEAQGIRWLSDVRKPVECVTDKAMLHSILNNLLSNAAEYCTPGGRIECRLRNSDGIAELSVRNSCASLTEEDLPHMFEPLWRKDAARSGGSHNGLGLALVDAFAQVLGVSIHTELTGGGEFVAALRIPAAFPTHPS